MVTEQSGISHPCRPCRSVAAHSLLDGVGERGREASELDARRELDACTGQGRIDSKPDAGEERRRGRPAIEHHLAGLAAAGDSLDMDRRRVTELDFDTELALQRVGDDLALDVAEERHQRLVVHVVVPYVDQRILGSEPLECGTQTGLNRLKQHRLVGGSVGDHRELRRVSSIAGSSAVGS